VGKLIGTAAKDLSVSSGHDLEQVNKVLYVGQKMTFITTIQHFYIILSSLII